MGNLYHIWEVIERMYADALKQMRTNSGMTLEKIAQVSGVPLSTVSRIMTGETKEPSIKAVADIVRAMGGSMDELTGITHESRSDSHRTARECEGDNCPMIRLYERQRVSDEQWRVSMTRQHEERVNGIHDMYEKRINGIEEKYTAQLATKDKWIRMLIISTIISLLIIAIIVVADLLLSDIGFIRR